MTDTIGKAVSEAIKFNGQSELNGNVKAVLNKNEDDLADAAADRAMAAVEDRAKAIVRDAYMHHMNITPTGLQAQNMIDSVMQEVLNRLAIILPDGWRTAKAFELLEESFVWAKRSVAIWDFNVANKKKDQE